MREILEQREVPAVCPVCFGWEENRPAHRYGPAVRTYWLLHYVSSGKGSFGVGDREYPIHTGEIFVIPPYTEIWYEGDPTEPWSYTWIGFTVRGEVPAALHDPVVSCPGAGRIFAEMRACGGRTYALAAEILHLLDALTRQEKPSDYVNLALGCMEAEYGQELTVSSLAARLGLDRSYFTALFRRQTGISPGKYLAALRLNKAAELMTEYGQSVAAAAYSCGYEDPAVFSRAFKGQFGLSPREYVRRNA